MNAYIKRLLVTWQHPEDQLFADGAILLNERGERFCDERCWPARELAVAQQPNKFAFILLDRNLAEKYSAWPHFISTAPKIAYAYVEDYLRLRPDVAIRDTSMEKVATKRNLPVDRMRTTIENVNRQRSTSNLPHLENGPWVLLGPVKAYFTTTEGGAAINEQCQVLDNEGKAIEGLYAVGQNGLGGQVLWGHGLHIAWAITSGKRVAEHLAHQAHEPRENQPEGKTD